MEGKVIKVVGSTSIFRQFLGRYGVVKEYDAFYKKWVVEFNATTKLPISEKDYKIVGEIY